MGSGGEKKVSLGRGCLLGSLTRPSRPQAAILQQTAEYIFSLEQEKTRLLQQNTQLKRFIQVVPLPPPLWRPRCCLSALLSSWLPFPCLACPGSTVALDFNRVKGCIFPTNLPTSGVCLPGPQFTHWSSAVGWALESKFILPPCLAFGHFLAL